MDLDRALRVFKQYCWNFKRDRLQAESLLLTDEERQVILELKGLIREYAGLFDSEEQPVAAKAA